MNVKTKTKIRFVDGKLPSKSKKFLVLNHTRKTYHFSDNGYCYRESDKNGNEVTYPSDKFHVLSGKKAVKENIPKGYRDDMK